MGAAHFYIAIRIFRHDEDRPARIVPRIALAQCNIRPPRRDDRCCPPRNTIPLRGNRQSDIKVIEVLGIPPKISESPCGTAMFAPIEIGPSKSGVSLCNRADLVVLCAGSSQPRGSGPPATRAAPSPDNTCASSQKWRDSAHDLIVLPADGHRSKTRG